MSGKRFDYIIVGTGPAGATLAHYLSEDPDNKILLIEAGTDRDNDPIVSDSANVPMIVPNYNPQFFWQNQEVGQTPPIGSFYYTGGRLLGGVLASMVNNMFVPLVSTWRSGRL